MEVTKELRDAIEVYRGGDKEAFTTIYKESNAYLRTCINNIVENYDGREALAEDIMQETYFEISKSIGKLGNVDSFLNWAATIARRKSYELIKKNSRYVLLPEEVSFEDMPDEDNRIPEQVVQNAEKQRIVREAIDSELNENEKACVVGFYYNDMKRSEIAEELNMPEGTVGTNLKRAKKKLAKVINITLVVAVAATIIFLLLNNSLWKKVKPKKTPIRDGQETTSSASEQQTTPEFIISEEKPPRIELLEEKFFRDDEGRYEHKVVRYEYDELAKLKWIVVEVDSGVSGEPLRERIYYKSKEAFDLGKYYAREQYNEYGDVAVKVTVDDLGNVSELIENDYWYEAGNSSYPSSKTITCTTTTYDEAGKKVKDAQVMEMYEYDNLYNVISKKVIDMDSANHITLEYEYEYDDECNLIMSKGAGEECIKTYDMNRLLTSEAYRNFQNAKLILYKYDDNGNMTERLEYYKEGWVKDYDKESTYLHNEMVSYDYYTYDLDDNQRVTCCRKNGTMEYELKYPEIWFDESTGEYQKCIDRPIHKDMAYKVIIYEKAKEHMGEVYVEVYNKQDEKMAEEYYITGDMYIQGICEEWIEYSYHYNAENKVEKVNKVINERGSNDLVYDEFFQVIERTETNTYNESGQLVKTVKVNERNTETYTNTYDEGGKLALTQYERKGLNYDDEEYVETYDITYTYDEKGRLYKDHLYTYEYDSKGRLVSKTINMDGEESNKKYIYKYIN